MECSQTLPFCATLMSAQGLLKQAPTTSHIAAILSRLWSMSFFAPVGRDSGLCADIRSHSLSRFCFSRSLPTLVSTLSTARWASELSTQQVVCCLGNPRNVNAIEPLCSNTPSVQGAQLWYLGNHYKHRRISKIKQDSEHLSQVQLHY